MNPPPPSPAADFRLAGLLSLGVLVVGLGGRGDPNPALLLAAVAAANLWLRYSGGPFVVLGGTAWLLLFPFGIPGYTAGYGEAHPETAFRADDLIVLGAAAVHLQCQFRGLGFGRRLIPADKAGGEPLKRPADLAPPAEYDQALWAALGSVVAAELVWWLLTASRFDPARFPPVRFDRVREPIVEAPLGRVMLSVLLVAAGGFLIACAFWLWRWATVPGDAAGMALLDVQWRENRRELQRIEFWRAWGRRKRAEPARGDGWSTWRRLRLGTGVFLVVFISVRLALR